MRLSSKHKKLLALALLGLLLGATNYFLFQPQIYLFKAFPLLPAYYISNSFTRHFMNGYFADICWCCALYLLTAVFTELKYLQMSGKVINLLLPFIIETLQYFRIIPGTFDWYDLLTYGLILVVFIKLFPLLKSTNHEKK